MKNIIRYFPGFKPDHFLICLRISFIEISIFVFLSCKTKIKNNPAISSRDTIHKHNYDKEKKLTFAYQLNVTHANINNNSKKQVDILYNGIRNFLGNNSASRLSFNLEFCMPCAPVQKFNDGILFAKRLLILKDSIIYYNADSNIPDSLNRVDVTDFRNNIKSKRIQDGSIHIKRIGTSCNDADFYKVFFTFGSKNISIDSILNVTSFEYDLNSDGHNEQYIFGSRNCSKELAIIRVRNPNQH